MRWGPKPAIAEQIIEQEGEYALALKDNHGNLYEEGKATFALAEKDAFTDLQWESGYGALEGPWSARKKGLLDHQ